MPRDLVSMSLRVAAEPRRRGVMTTKANMDSDAAGPSRMRSMGDFVDHLEANRLNAVLIETGEEESWVAVFRDVATGKYSVARVPTTESGNVLSKKVESAADAVSAAMQV